MTRNLLHMKLLSYVGEHLIFSDSLHSACAVRGSFAKFRMAERAKSYYWRVFSVFNAKNEKQTRKENWNSRGR